MKTKTALAAALVAATLTATAAGATPDHCPGHNSEAGDYSVEFEGGFYDAVKFEVGAEFGNKLELEPGVVFCAKSGAHVVNDGKIERMGSSGFKTYDQDISYYVVYQLPSEPEQTTPEPTPDPTPPGPVVADDPTPDEPTEDNPVVETDERDKALAERAEHSHSSHHSYEEPTMTELPRTGLPAPALAGLAALLLGGGEGLLRRSRK